MLDKHCLEKGQPAVIVSGHAHKSLNTLEQHVGEMCLLPMLTMRKNYAHVGSALNVKSGSIDFCQLGIINPKQII